MTQRPAFLTGSRIYGNPGPDSDLDLVVRVGSGDMDLLAEFSDGKGLPIRFGKLNLICCYSDEQYDAFADAFEECVAEAPVTRERAVDIHIKHLKNHGVYSESDDYSRRPDDVWRIDP